MQHKVNFLAGVYWFNFRDFNLQTGYNNKLKEPSLPYYYLQLKGK